MKKELHKAQYSLGITTGGGEGGGGGGGIKGNFGKSPIPVYFY